MFATLDAPHARDTDKGEELRRALCQLGAFLLNRGAEGLAAMPLHGHFPVLEGTTLLDTTNVGKREITTQIVPIDRVARAQSSVWGFTMNGTPTTLVWREGTQADSRLIEDVIATGKFLVCEELNSVLAVMALDMPFPVRRDEIMLEVTDEASRTQVTKVVPRKDVPIEQDTVWRFELAYPHIPRGSILPEHVALVAVRGCDPGC